MRYKGKNKMIEYLAFKIITVLLCSAAWHLPAKWFINLITEKKQTQDTDNY